MTDADAMPNLILGALSAASVVMFGALYALLFAWGRLHRQRAVVRSSYAAFGALTLATFLLVSALGLADFWRLVIGVMLLGYLIAPHLIWQLCIGTHATRPGGEAPSAHEVPGRPGGSR